MGGISNLAAGATINKPADGKSSICKNLFSQNSFGSEKIPPQLRSVKPLSENLMPVEEESMMDDYFCQQRKPFSGFDIDNVIVPKTKQRQIPKIPFKVLDAPALKDDYYLNLVDWSE